LVAERNPNVRPERAEKKVREKREKAPPNPNASRKERNVKAPKPPKPEVVLSRTEHQSGVYMEIRRDQIQGAPWNPRRISSYARGLLKKKLETVGCVTPITWNRRSGLVVGGHQRLSILDELEGSQSYIVGVMAIDVDEKTEREMNVQLNNRQSQGQFDKDPFLAMIADGSLDLAEAGMTRIDMEIEFGRLPEIAGIFAQEQAAAQPVIDQLQEIATASPFRAEFRSSRKGPQFGSARWQLLPCRNLRSRAAGRVDAGAWVRRERAVSVGQPGYTAGQTSVS
jgi:hypothetical protein